MKHEHALKLIELFIDQGFNISFIAQTLVNCEEGMGLGHAMFQASNDLYPEDTEKV